MAQFEHNGILYEEMPGEQARVIGPASSASQGPQPFQLSGPDPSKALRDKRTLQEIEDADYKAKTRDRPTLPTGYRWKNGQVGGEAERIPGTANSTGKPMRQGDADKLASQVDSYSYLKDSLAGFKDDFAGNTVTGELENYGQGLLGTGTPGQRDWWANFRTADNLIRNSLFGASLTSGEKAAYEATTVSPGMAAAEVKTNIERRLEITRKALTRQTKRLRTVYDNDEIDAAVGEFGADFNSFDKPKPQADPARKPPSVSAPGTQYGAAQEGVRDTSKVFEPSERGQQIVADMIRAGRPYDETQAAIGTLGLTGNITPESYQAAVDFARQYPTAPVDVASIGTTSDPTMTQRFASSDVGATLAGSVNGTTMGFGDEIGGAIASLGNNDGLAANIARANASKQAMRDNSPLAFGAGEVAGGVASSLLMPGASAVRGAGLLRPMMADAAYGAAYGAGEGNDNRMMGAGVGLALGAGGNLAGRGVVSAAGGAMRGVTNPDVLTMRARDIPMTGGQAMGGAVKTTEDALTSVPLLGDMINARRREGVRAFNREAFNDAGAPINAQVNETGQEGLQALVQARSQAYRDALDPVNVNMNDPQTIADLAATIGQAQRIPNVNGAQDAATAALQNRIGGAVDPGTDTLSGRNFQEAYRGLARTGRERANSDYGYEVGQVMRQGQDALAGTLQRQAPGAFEGFRAANATNRNAMTLADALRSATNQPDNLFTPAQLNRADANSTRRLTGPLASASGDRPFAGLADSAQEVLPSSVPDSGTAKRLMLGGLAAAGLPTAGAGVGYAAGDTGTGAGVGAGGLGAVGILSLLNTRGGARMLQAALLNRPQAVQRVGGMMVNTSNTAGRIAGAGAAPALLDYYSR